MNDVRLSGDAPWSDAAQRPAGLRRSVLLLFGLAIALVVVLAGATYVTARKYAADQRWTAHSFEVREQILQVMDGVRIAEMEARSYGLTGRSASLQAYWRAVADVERATDDLDTLVSDNPDQVAAARRLRAAIGTQRSLFEAILDTYRDRGAAAAHLAVINLITVHQLPVRELGLRMLASEEALLKARARRRDHNANRVGAIAILSLGSCIAVLLAALARIAREQKVRMRSEQALGETAERLQIALQQASEVGETLRHLARLAELLQNCRDIDEAIAVIERALPPLLPEVSGALALLNASRNIVEARMHWGERGSELGDAVFGPDDCWALRRSQPHPGEDDHAAPLCTHLVQAGVTAHESLCLPLNSQGQVSGVLSLVSVGPFTARMRRVATSAADQLALALANLNLQASLRTQSIRDPLTSLFNRRYLEASLPRELLRAERRSGGLSVLMLDLDHFKRYNDTQGHDAGDALLGAFGTLLAQSCRGEDIPCRFGGEEFVMVLTDADHAHALARAEVVRKAVSELAVHYRTGLLPPPTVSIGVASYPEHGDGPEALIHMADRALYRAKHQGRNRVASAGDLPVAPSAPPGLNADP